MFKKVIISLLSSKMQQIIKLDEFKFTFKLPKTYCNY